MSGTFCQPLVYVLLTLLLTVVLVIPTRINLIFASFPHLDIPGNRTMFSWLVWAWVQLTVKGKSSRRCLKSVSGRYAHTSQFSLASTQETADKALVGESHILTGLLDFSSDSGKLFFQQSCVEPAKQSIQSGRKFLAELNTPAKTAFHPLTMGPNDIPPLTSV